MIFVTLVFRINSFVRSKFKMKENRIKTLKALLIIYTSVFTLFSCAGGPCKNLNSSTCPVLKDFQVFNKNSEIHFNHLCSDLEHDSEFARQSYVLFEKSSSKEKALVLAKLRLGWLGLNTAQGIAVDFLEIKIESSWSASTPISFALSARNNQSGKNLRGAFVNEYLKGPHSKVSYQLDENGNINWYDFLEPENRTGADLTNHPTPSPSITINQLSDKTMAYQLFLILKNNNSKEEIRLEGPYINNIESFLEIEKPEVRVLGLLDTLNPFQKGGLWDWLSLGAKYDKCIYARKKSRQEFQQIFKQI